MKFSIFSREWCFYFPSTSWVIIFKLNKFCQISRFYTDILLNFTGPIIKVLFLLKNNTWLRWLTNLLSGHSVIFLTLLKCRILSILKSTLNEPFYWKRKHNSSKLESDPGLQRRKLRRTLKRKEKLLSLFIFRFGNFYFIALCILALKGLNENI